MAATPSKWQATLSFGDRMSAVETISNALISSTSLSQTESREKARNIEAKLYESAIDRTTYDQGCRIYPSGTEDADSQPEEDDFNEGENPTEAIAIGKYPDASHYKDGLFSSIYKARAVLETHDDEMAPNPAEYVALKITTPSQMSQPHDSAREARILQSTRNSHIIPMLDTFQLPGGRFVLVFPFLPYDLETLLRKKALTQGQVKSHLREMLRGLEFLHSNGIIHRDVKPSNILLKSRTGPAYLADFGIAWSPRDDASESEDSKITDVGTTSYRPPELLFGNQSYGCSLDLWSAGCIVAEAASLGSEPLFDAGDLGSELALIRSIFKTLGTPNLETWPEARTFPDWGKMEFYQFPKQPWEDVIPDATPQARNLVAAMIKYESGTRLSAAQAVEHDYLKLG